jgi:hypothetical protein
MSKARFGIAALLTLGIAPAWAGDGKADERATSDTVAVNQDANASTDASEASASKRERRNDGDGSRVAQAGTGSSEAESRRPPLSDDEMWLIVREGYRDGGY